MQPQTLSQLGLRNKALGCIWAISSLFDVDMSECVLVEDLSRLGLPDAVSCIVYDNGFEGVGQRALLDRLGHLRHSVRPVLPAHHVWLSVGELDEGGLEGGGEAYTRLANTYDSPAFQIAYCLDENSVRIWVRKNIDCIFSFVFINKKKKFSLKYWNWRILQ